MSIESTLNLLVSETSLESKIKESLYDTYGGEKPSKKVISNILSFAASYECQDSKIGKIELMLN